MAVRFKYFKFIFVVFLIFIFIAKCLLDWPFFGFYHQDRDQEDRLRQDRGRSSLISLSNNEGTNISTNSFYVAPIDVALIFTNVAGNVVLQYHLKRCVGSLLKAASVPIRLHLITDEEGFTIGSTIIRNVQLSNQFDTRHLKLVYVSATTLASDVRPVVEILQEHFTSARDSYYRDFLFFFSLFLDRILPGLDNIILMDIDVLVKGDVAELFSHFSKFKNEQIIGMSPELSTVYRHLFSVYRNKHPDTPIGSSRLTGGFPGYNSGVMLINMPKLRNSHIIASYLSRGKLRQAVMKYGGFRGHLGDQDLFTLIALDHPEVFYTLPCNWNRQLCQWWKTKGYERVFDQYFNCSGEIYIYHGNCKTEIPNDEGS